MKILVSILFVLLSQTLHPQSHLLGDYDFNKDSYKLIVYHHDLKSYFTECFFISDKIKLQSLKDNWLGEETNVLYECDYDYYLYLVHSDSIVASFNVNTECGQVSSNKSLLNYKGNPFQYLLKDGNAFKKRLSFSNLDTARKAFDKYKQNKNYYIIDADEPEWVKYDGFFFVKVDSGYNRNQIEAKIEEFSKEQIAGNPIKIRLETYDSDLFILTVYSNKEYYLDFNLGKKDVWNSYDYPAFDVIYTDDAKDF
jgi:hypothetical protein